MSGYGEAFVCDFIKEITIRGKIDEGNYLGEATKVEVADLNLIIDRLRNAYRFEKRILNRELAGSWGIISYLFQNRTGLFLYGIFSQLITGSTGNVSSEIKQE